MHIRRVLRRRQPFLLFRGRWHPSFSEEKAKKKHVGNPSINFSLAERSVARLLAMFEGTWHVQVKSDTPTILPNYQAHVSGQLRSEPMQCLTQRQCDTEHDGPSPKWPNRG